MAFEFLTYERKEQQTIDDVKRLIAELKTLQTSIDEKVFKLYGIEENLENSKPSLSDEEGLPHH